ncbi:MAG: putative mandelate racemase/muconate-lactonizing protein [Betaproteobacteria bacterium]|nr:putative mandelate racemase/muconate-lactonizing protein [Betaproteobacteria bacterium]
MTTADLRPARIEAFVLDAPIENPVTNSFRTLTSRTSLFVRVTDEDGAFGWGEIWCNYPPGAAGHRAELLERVVAPMIVGRRFAHPREVFAYLETATRVPALQSGEPGPFAQVVAGIDIALWDLAARRAGEPLWRWLGGKPTVRVYASGLGPDRPERLAEKKLAEGYTAVKVKVGFDTATDERNLRALRTAMGAGAEIMVDANQRWGLEAAIEAARWLDGFGLAWIEEPIPADETVERWQALARACGTPLAAGENLRGYAALGAAVTSGALKVIQPDAAKWGGFSGCLDIMGKAREAGVQFCPHWLGGGVGLAAALHLLAASGAAGWGEVDANPNELRTLFLPEGFSVHAGRVTLSDQPGLGCIPDPSLMARFRVRR